MFTHLFFYMILMIGSAKRKQDNTNTIQSLISQRMRELYNMSNWIEKTDKNMVANTYGVVCPKCHVKDNIYAETVQTRSGDEAADRLCVCLNCGYSWKIHGG